MTYLERKSSKLNTEKIKVVATDIDGVLTDGKIFYFNGKIYRNFNIKDGTAFKLLSIAGIKTVVISAKKSEETKKRFSELKVDCYIEGTENKLSVIERFIIRKKGIKWNEICYIGDDLQDIPVMRKAGLSFAPSNACPEVKDIADYICKKNGGEGAFRETVEVILKGKGIWEGILKKFLASL
ncbi:MAG: HAD hydrolase family protein [Candidatus Omnitrophica bacterium]|nr:HAD hydrolase family protein [Candidatus Omnitrophota bacterium]